MRDNTNDNNTQIDWVRITLQVVGWVRITLQVVGWVRITLQVVGWVRITLQVAGLTLDSLSGKPLPVAGAVKLC